MKKFLTALIAFVMCFSVVTTAFAATPDETSDSDLISDIKQAMLDTYYGDEKPDFIEVRIYGTASDGVRPPRWLNGEPHTGNKEKKSVRTVLQQHWPYHF